MNLSKEVFNANIKKGSTREAFGEALAEMGEAHPNVVVLTADLEESVKVDKFAHAFPKRFIEVGIAEQNLAGISAGLAMNGKVPVMASYAAFSPSTNWKQIRLHVAQSSLNVKVVGTHSGLSPAADGSTHQALEDIALMRVLPNFTIIAPADYEQTKRALEAALLIKGPVYLRLTRNPTPKFTTAKTPFEIGKAQVLNEGKDVTIIATGPIVYEALKAARELGLKHRVDVEVINCHTIKPLDSETILKSAKKTKHVVTIEEHQIAGGLGGAVAELLSETLPTKLMRLGVNDTFGESGEYEDLLKIHKIDHLNISKQVFKFVKN